MGPILGQPLSVFRKTIFRFKQHLLYRRGANCAILGLRGSEWARLGQGEAKMVIGNNLSGLNSIFGVTQTAPVSGPKKSTSSGNVTNIGDDEATLSSAGSAFSMAATGSAVRSSKVASIQAAISRGYNVPSSAVANKMVEFMMGRTA